MGIYFTVSFFIRDHLPATPEPDNRAVIRQAFLLEPWPITFKLPAHAVELPEMRHPTTACKFDVISPLECILAVEFPPRHVEVHSPYPIVIMGWHFLELGEIAGAARSDGIRQVTPH